MPNLSFVPPIMLDRVTNADVGVHRSLIVCNRVLSVLRMWSEYRTTLLCSLDTPAGVLLTW